MVKIYKDRLKPTTKFTFDGKSRPSDENYRKNYDEIFKKKEKTNEKTKDNNKKESE